MKPINLKIKGINSYVSEQQVDFGKLAENNIFGIFGETGSGKTTILDSIILALYGVSDRDVLQNIINVVFHNAISQNCIIWYKLYSIFLVLSIGMTKK